MKPETIKRVVDVLNRYIKYYSWKLLTCLEIKAESEFRNGNLDLKHSGEYETDIKRYEIILSDLLSVKRAIKNGVYKIKLYGTLTDRDYVYPETLRVYKKAGIKACKKENQEFIELYIDDNSE